MTFSTSDAFQVLESMDQQSMDQLEFGVVRMTRQGEIKAYNQFELELSGNQRDEVLGKNFFQQIAPCTNNFMVAEKYQTDQALDEQMDYVFTYRMEPTKVRLRLMAAPGSDHQYLLVEKS